ncbi:MAG: hypothetical protein JNL11_20300 [Bdellovibrionaceae bacterium]|nr:hypothetical protein [Pseudobdellovibrionaceae bacterium]
MYLDISIKDQILIPQPNYAAAKIHAKIIDDRLGLQCEKIESEINSELNKDKLGPSLGQNFWYGLDIQSLQTPYSEIVEMIHFIKPKSDDTWIDLGAGYGRMGITLGLIAPDVNFIGYEYVQPRVDEGNRVLQQLSFTQAQIKHMDISKEDFQLPQAQLYFLYDFGSREDVYKIFEKLKSEAKNKPIQVVARGRGVRNWILMDCPWLCEVHSPVHFSNWSYFKS